MSREMKDSGVEWVGEIPKDWEVSKIKRIARIYTGNSIKDNEKENYTNYENSIPYIPTKAIDVNNSVIDYNNGLYIPLDDINFKIAKKGSILVCIEGGSAGKKIAYLNQDVCFVNKLCCFESINFNNKYLYYYIKSPAFSNEFSLHISGLIGGVSQGEIKEFSIAIPSLLEQQKIANFLDEKVGEIDRLIDNAKKSIEEYKKYKQSIITEAVTKGLDPNLEMKDSGIEWIGEIPKDWNISNIGRMCFVTKLAGFEYTKDMVNNISYNGEVPIVRAQNIKMGRFIDNINEYISTDLSKELDRSALNKKCLIMTFIGAGIGEVAIFNKKSRYHLAPNVAKIVINNNMNKFILEEFLLYFIMSFSGQEEINKIKKSTAQPSLSMETIRSIKIIVTKTLKEQKDIVSYLDSKCAEIDSLISKKEKLISELEKYKKSLIYEYVTGKKEVL